MRVGHRLIVLVAALLAAGVSAAAAIATATPAARSNACVLPHLRGTPLNVVRQVLPLLGCQIGSVTRAASVSIEQNDMIGTRPTAGTYRRNTAIHLVVSGGPVVAGLRAPGDDAIGNGTNDDPYTVPKCTEFDIEGHCELIFHQRYLGDWPSNEYVPAYRCPTEAPWLLNKSLSPGRIVPPGVLFGTERGKLGVNITGVSIKIGKTKPVGQRELLYEYATGTKAGFPFSSVTSWSFFDGSVYRIRLYCTGDLKQANLVNIRG